MVNEDRKNLLPEVYEPNLSDFALFLSVMKKKKAYENTLSIVMNEPELALKEVEGLHLDDGTTKIFLNMKSKNGRPELVSLLQYMKKSTLDNPEIVVKDPRIVELDRIVNEVKQTEEWETVRMNILEIGLQQGLQEGIKSVIRNMLAQNMSDEEIMKLTACTQEMLEEVKNEQRDS